MQKWAAAVLKAAYLSFVLLTTRFSKPNRELGLKTFKMRRGLRGINALPGKWSGSQLSKQNSNIPVGLVLRTGGFHVMKW